MLISSEPDLTLVAEASNGREAIQPFRVHRPDVTIMDLQMPEMNGLDAIIAIRAEFPDAKIIVLTTYKGDVQILRALKAGAQGYLLKNMIHKDSQKQSARSTLERRRFLLKPRSKSPSMRRMMP